MKSFEPSTMSDRRDATLARHAGAGGADTSRRLLSMGVDEFVADGADDASGLIAVESFVDRRHVAGGVVARRYNDGPLEWVRPLDASRYMVVRDGKLVDGHRSPQNPGRLGWAVVRRGCRAHSRHPVPGPVKATHRLVNRGGMPVLEVIDDDTAASALRGGL